MPATREDRHVSCSDREAMTSQVSTVASETVDPGRLTAVTGGGIGEAAVAALGGALGAATGWVGSMGSLELFGFAKRHQPLGRVNTVIVAGTTLATAALGGWGLNKMAKAPGTR
jgi:hypothetical protein